MRIDAVLDLLYVYMTRSRVYFIRWPLESSIKYISHLPTDVAKTVVPSASMTGGRCLYRPYVEIRQVGVVRSD